MMLNAAASPSPLLFLSLVAVGCGGHTASPHRAAGAAAPLTSAAAPTSAAPTGAAPTGATAPLDAPAPPPGARVATASSPAREPQGESDDDEPALDCTTPHPLIQRLLDFPASSEVPGPPRPWAAKPIPTEIDGLVFYRWVSGKCHARPMDGEVNISCGGRPHWVKGGQLVRDKEWGIPLHRVGGKLLVATVAFHDAEPYPFTWGNEGFSSGEFVLVDAKGGWFFGFDGETVGELQPRSFGVPRAARPPVWPSDALACTIVQTKSSAREYTLYVECGDAREVRRLTWDGTSVTSAPASAAEVELAGRTPKLLPDAAPAWAQEIEQCAEPVRFDDDYGSTYAPPAPKIFMSGSDYWLNTGEGVYSTKKSRYTWAVTGIGHFEAPELELLPIPAGEGCTSQSTRILATTAASAARVLPARLHWEGEPTPFARSELATMNFNGEVWVMLRGEESWGFNQAYYPYGHCIAPEYLRPVPTAWLKGVKFADE